MKKTITILATSAALVASAQAAVVYQYSFETADSTVNSGPGTAVATAQGSVTSGAGTGSSGFFADFDGGDVAGSDAVNVDLSVSAIALNNFDLSFSVNQVASVGFDDYLTFQTTGGAHFAFETNGVGNLQLFNIGTGGGGIGSSVDTSNSLWRTIRMVGSAGTLAADSTVELLIDGASIGTAQLTGGATQTITNMRLGGRVGADNRYSDFGLDEVVIDVTPVPEPSSTALLGLGGLALILRRRK